MPEVEKTGPGYTVDPYKDEGGECEDAITKLFSFTGKAGTFSTWRERHIGIAGAVAGLKAGTFENVPPCPPLWQDECQYFDGCAMIANVVKCQWPTVSLALGALASVKLVLPAIGIAI